MPRLLVLLVAVLSLAAVPAPLAAQDDVTPAAGGPALEDPVSVLGSEGAEAAVLTVTDLVDPFQDYDPNPAPLPGHHFVLLTIAIENTGAQPLTFDPRAIILQDDDGFLAAPATISRPDPIVPDLAVQDLAPGAQATGAIGFAVLNDVDLARVVYQPGSDRLIVLADLGAPAPALGDPAPIVGPDGVESARVTIDEAADPFETYDPDRSPARGTHYVLLTITIENTGPRPLAVDPNDLFLQDADGFVARPTTVLRAEDAAPADLPSGELAPGASVSGAVGFAVFNNVDLALVLFAPASDRLIVLADLATGTTAPAESTAAAADADEPTPNADEPTPDVQAGVSGNAYLSPTYGFAVAWDDTWTVADESSDDAVDVLVLDNGTSTVSFTAAVFDGDVGACLDTAVDDLEADPDVAETTLAEVSDGTPFEQRTATRSMAVYIVADDAGTGSARYLECRALGPVGAALTVTQTVPIDAYNSEAAARQTLFNAFVLQGPGRRVSTQGAVHVDRGEDHETYASVPPVSGPHIGDEVAPWGVSPDPIDDEVQVHNLEHGGVFLQYACDCPEAIAILEALADPASGYPTKVVAAPYPDLESEVALSAWGVVQELTADQVDDETVRAFIEAYIDGGPELIAPETEELAAWRAADDDATKEPSDNGTTPAATADCAGLDDWVEETGTRLERASQLSLEDAEFPDPAVFEDHRTEYAALADAQAAVDVPPTAAEANDAAVSVLTAYADAIDLILDLDVGADPTAFVEGVNAFNDAGTALSAVRADVNQLAADCGVG